METILSVILPAYQLFGHKRIGEKFRSWISEFHIICGRTQWWYAFKNKKRFANIALSTVRIWNESLATIQVIHKYENPQDKVNKQTAKSDVEGLKPN